MTYLPYELWCRVCAQLWHQKDFNTLFNCACSGKQLASISLMNLYRVISDPNGGSDEDPDGESVRREWDPTFIRSEDRRLGRIDRCNGLSVSQERSFIKWAGLWRTIILSSLGKTLYPYSQYIRTLDLQDLENLLHKFALGPIISADFFQGELTQFLQGELAQFKVTKARRTRIQSRLGATDELDAEKTIYRIEDAIMKQTPLLEELAGGVPSRALSRWIPRLPRLTHLEPVDGAALKANGPLIRLHCPSFKRLHLSRRYCPSSKRLRLSQQVWDRCRSNESLPAFLNGLRPLSIESFKTAAVTLLGPLVFQALNCHGESLTDLRLNMGSHRDIPNFSLLKGCTNLVSVSLSISTYTYDHDLLSCNDRFRETVAWLKECKKLRILCLIRFCKTAWIAPILLENNIHLTSFDYRFGLWDARLFMQALENQTSLQRLWLKELMAEDVSAIEPDVVVKSLSKLVNLTDLRLDCISNDFIDRHMVQLAGSLPRLKVWSTAGHNFTDAIWGEVASLRSLRRLHIVWGQAVFTVNGILDFIQKLGPGNRGLALQLSYNTGSSLTDEDRSLIHKTMVKKLEGKFFVEGEFDHLL